VVPYRGHRPLLASAFAVSTDQTLAAASAVLTHLNLVATPPRRAGHRRRPVAAQLALGTFAGPPTQFAG
jgi:hypothetical protein